MIAYSDRRHLAGSFGRWDCPGPDRRHSVGRLPVRVYIDVRHPIGETDQQVTRRTCTLSLPLELG